MSGPGPAAEPRPPKRLSLRARLLVLLVAVTAAFLVIMGVVTTVVLSRQLHNQFRADLVAAAARPRALAANPAGDLAVIMIPVTRQVTVITPGRQGSELGQVVGRLGRPQLVRDYANQPFPLRLPDGTALQAVVRLVAARKVAATRRGWAVLVVARPQSRVIAPLHGVVLAELITGGALLLLLAAGGQWLIGRGLSPLGKMAGTANRITTQGDLTARMPEAGDGTETGQLGTAINTMLDRIQQAFSARLRSEEKVRQFAADASHELRTPLTTIRGYAELYRAGALGPDQLPDAMRRIEQEAERMSRLVAELLELARLDRGSSLDLADTDLAALVRDAVADARAVEPGRPVEAEAPGRLIATVDEARIRQVLANLLGNVREHTPAAHLSQPYRDRGGAGGRRRRSWHAATGRGARLRPVPPGRRRGRPPDGRPPDGRGAARRAAGRRRAARRQRSGAVHRAGHRAGPRRPGRPGVLAGPGNPGPGVAARLGAFLTYGHRPGPPVDSQPRR